MKRHIGIYKLDKGWLNWLGEWVESPVMWWDGPSYYDKDEFVFFNNLLQQTKDVFVDFWNNDDVTDIWLVPFEDEYQIYWTDAIRLS